MPFVATLSSDSVSVREDRASMFWQGFANILFVIRRSRSLPCHLDLISRACHVARLSSDSVSEGDQAGMSDKACQYYYCDKPVSLAALHSKLALALPMSNQDFFVRASP